MSNAHRALLIEEIVKTLRVVMLLEEMASDLVRINPKAAETAALAMIRIRNKMTRLSDNFWTLTLD